MGKVTRVRLDEGSDVELEVLGAVVGQLKRIDADARDRVMSYLDERFSHNLIAARDDEDEPL